MEPSNKSRGSLRDGLFILATLVVGLAIGTIAGYLTYSIPILDNNPLIVLKVRSTESPLEQTYRGMAAFSRLEGIVAGCGGRPGPPEIVQREDRVIDYIEASSKKANLVPPLAVARAIVAYRGAKLAEMRSDKQASENAFRDSMAYLQAAGWKKPSLDSLAIIVRQEDGCRQHDGTPGEKK